MREKRDWLLDLEVTIIAGLIILAIARAILALVSGEL